MLLSILDVLLLITTCNFVFSTTGACYAYLRRIHWWRVPVVSTTTYTVGIISYLLAINAMDNVKAIIFIVVSVVAAITLTLVSSFSAWLFMHVIDKKDHLYVKQVSWIAAIYKVGIPWIPVIRTRLGAILSVIGICLGVYVTHYSLQNKTIYISDTNIASKIKCRIYKPLIELDQLLNDDSVKCINR